MTSFGVVPIASAWPCARWVEAITSPSSSAAQTPTATASCPIATWRKPGSSPARNRSSTFSSKRRISSISRNSSRWRSFESVGVRFSTLATARKSMLRAVALVGHWREIEARLPADWSDARLLLSVEDEAKAPRAAALLGPAMPGRRGREIRFYCASRGAGVSPDAVRRMLERLDEEKIAGRLELLAAGEPTEQPETARATLQGSWDAELAVLPPDWSDLYAEIELTSSDHLERAALLLSPLNPARY